MYIFKDHLRKLKGWDINPDGSGDVLGKPSELCQQRISEDENTCESKKKRVFSMWKSALD